MFAFTVRRILASIPVMIISTFLTFMLTESIADPLARFRGRNPPIPHNVIVDETKRLGLDQPLLPRYFLWLKNLLLHGRFGQSVNQTYDIGQHLGHAMVVTLRLVTASIFLALFLALITGILSAVKQYSKLDYSATFVGFICLSLPTFWFAILIKNWAIQANNSIGHTVFFTLGEESANPPTGFWASTGDALGHLILPTIILSLVTYATWSRFLRSSMLDVLNSDYMRLAKAKGLSPSRVMLRHGLRTALIPMATQVAIDIAGLLSGTIITEFIFNWNGMGSMFIDGLNNQDVNVLLAWLLVVAMFVIVFNLIADLLYAVLDPRIRLA
jgi:peptide/nickel transport system permease protein